MICPTVHLPGHIPPLKSADECGRKWSALCLSAYRAIHRMLVPESLRWRDSSVHIERPMETDGRTGTFRQASLISPLKTWGIFLPVIARGINYCVPKRDAMHSLRVINGLYAAHMEHWLSVYVSDISRILLSMSPPQTLVKNVPTRQMSAHSLCYCVKFPMDF